MHNNLRIDVEASVYHIPAEQHDELILRLKEYGFNVEGGRDHTFGVNHVRYGNMGFLYDVKPEGLILLARNDVEVVKPNPLETFVYEQIFEKMLPTS